MNKSFRSVVCSSTQKNAIATWSNDFSQSRVFQWTTTYIWVCLSQKVIIWCVSVCNNTQVAVAADSRPAGLNESQPGEFHFHGSLILAQTQSITALTHSHSLPLSKPGLESSDALRHLPYTQSVTSITLHNHSTLKHTYTPNQAYLYSSTEAWQPNKCSIVRTSQHTKHSTTAAQERCVTEAPMGDG